jgi:hypothetical protein
MNSLGHEPNQRKKVIFRTYQVIWYFLGVIETLLGFRFIFKLLGANSGSPFVSLTYSLSGIFLSPFRAIFPTISVEGSVFEWSSLIAMAIYAVLAYGLVYFFQLVKPVESDEIEHVIDNP